MLQNVTNIDMLVQTTCQKSLVTPWQLALLLQNLHIVCEIGIPGNVVELGCFHGGTSIALQKLLLEIKSDKQLHLYDSFEGLPSIAPQDLDKRAQWQFGADAGAMCTTLKELQQNFDNAGVPLLHVHAGWFDKLSPEEYPEQIAFSFIDGDFYSSIMSGLNCVYPRLSKGAVCYLHDYGPNNPLFPGVEVACTEFFIDKPETLVLVNEMAYFVKT